MSQAPTDEIVQRDLDIAIEIARDAGSRILALKDEKTRKGEIRWSGKTLADVGDQAGDGYLQGFLRGRYADDGLLSEETADSPDRLAKHRAWIVDPLDGTKEYSQLREDWAVHVALTLGGQCALAAVALPSADDVLWGVALPGRERAGATSGAALTHGDSDVPAKPRLIVSRSHSEEWHDALADKLGAEKIGCGSAGFKVAELVRGNADVYVHKIGLKEWDTCAPETIARALGWHVCKLRGDEHRYNQANPRNNELVVCRPAMRERVLEAIEAAGVLTA